MVTEIKTFSTNPSQFDTSVGTIVNGRLSADFRVASKLNQFGISAADLLTQLDLIDTNAHTEIFFRGQKQPVCLLNGQKLEAYGLEFSRPAKN